MAFLRIFIVTSIITLLLSVQANAETVSPLVETDWLANNLSKVIVLDVRTSKKSFVTAATYNKDKATGQQWLSHVGGHIPNAQFVLYKNVRGDRLVDGNTIGHMVVTAPEFEKIMQAAGVNQDSHIVITTNAESGFDLTMASRMYWQIKYFGHDNVSILNGGTAQWLADGRESTTSLDNVDTGNWQAKPEVDSIFADSHKVSTASKDENLQIVDVRPLGQYLGTFKSGKAKAKGHIPSAKVFPVDLLSTRTMPVKFSSIEELQQLSQALGVNLEKPIITYCNSGHMASGAWFAFHALLGNKDVRLYDGSMHQWTLEERPVVSMIIE